MPPRRRRRRPRLVRVARRSTTSSDCSHSKVSLSEDLRHELAAITPRSECDRLAELSGLFHSAGSVHLRRARRGIRAPGRRRSGGRAPRVQPPARVRRLVRDPDLSRAGPSRAATRYQLHVAGDERALQVLHEAGVLSSRLTPLEHPPRRVVARSCCRAAYLRGALLGGGSLSGPRSPHLEIRSAGTRARVPRADRERRKERGSASSTAAACGRLRQGHGGDRGRPRARRSERDRAALRGARRHGRDTLACQSPGECGPRESRPDEPGCARSATGGQSVASNRRAGKLAAAPAGDRRAT